MSSPSLPVLQQLHRLDRSSPDFQDQLRNVLYGEEYTRCVPELQDNDLIWLVDYLDKTLDGLDPSSATSRKCLRELRSRCGASATLPTSYTLSCHLFNIGSDPFAKGGYGDVYKGTLDGSSVCVKRIRVYTKDDPKKTAKAFCQEAVMWKRLTHPNVLPLLGVTIAPLQLISNWMPGGDLQEYIRENSDADRHGLLSDITKGLGYLHTCNVIHGDVKGPNVLVDDSGHARIADFGLATVTKNLDSVQSATAHHGHSLRWSAPEVLMQGMHSKEADIFAFAMVMIEVFTGAPPFGDSPSCTVMFTIVDGRRPSRPTHPTFTDKLWTLMQRCWDQEPHSRPEVSEALQILLTPEEPTWKRLISHTLPAHERVLLITTIFSDTNQIEMVRQLTGDDAQTFIDMIDEALDSLTSEIRRGCLNYLRRICGDQALLPRSLAIPLCYDPTENPMCHGGYSDVWKGQYNGEAVAAKVVRVYLSTNPKEIIKKFCREVVAWKSLHHPSVLPLLGITMTENLFVMVSEWMENGNINEFVKEKPHADRLGLLVDVTTGLVYMRDQGIIHGNLKGENILVDNSGHACLAGFSLLTQTSDQPTVTTSTTWGGSIRWMGPERLSPREFGLKDGRPTKESDCYALGMTIYEVLSGQVPFAQDDREIRIAFKIMNDERPTRLQGTQGTWFTDSLWEMLELCWKRQPGDRPSLETVLQCLQGDRRPLRSLSDAGGDVETDTNDRPNITAGNSGSPTTHGDNGLPVPPFPSPPRVTTTPTIPQDGGQPPDSPKTKASDPTEERIVERFTRGLRRIFKISTRKLDGR